MTSRAGIPGTAQQSPTLKPTTLSWESDNYAHGWLGNSLHMQQCGITHQAVFDNTAPNTNLLLLVSKRNGLSMLAKANTRTSRHAFLSVSKAACM